MITNVLPPFFMVHSVFTQVHVFCLIMLLHLLLCVVFIAAEVQTVITIPKDFDLETLLG